MGYKNFPVPLPLRKLIGPSFVILALGLGSGEIILWPYLVSNYGLGIAWGAVLGISFQFFINMEIERYTLVKGESVFVGFKRLLKWAPWWFIFSTFIGFGLPGIVAASAKVLGALIGISNFKWTAIVMLLFIGFILSVGKTAYGMMERITKTVIMFGVPFIFILTIIASTKFGWLELAKGVVGMGSDYLFFPVGIVIATFLGAFAYSGAGGNLNLTQSIYVKEKGYGMGKYAQKISGLFGRKKMVQEIKLSGEKFELTENNIKNFKQWWRRVNLEHLLVFWLVGLISMMMLMLLAYSTAYGMAGNTQGISFIINEGKILAGSLAPIVGSLFLLAVAIMLFQTQLGVIDSTSRIMSENYALSKLGHDLKGKINLSEIYFIFVWAQVGFGIILFLFGIYEPKTLIILGAVINAFAMFIHIGLTSWLNYKTLPKVFQPGWIRRSILAIIFLFFGFFSTWVLCSHLF
ncbi:MAG: Nramp family divalent metal transporter [bacterium]